MNRFTSSALRAWRTASRACHNVATRPASQRASAPGPPRRTPSAVAPHELRRAVGERVGAGRHRQPVQVAAQVLRQRAHGGVAPLGLLAQGRRLSRSPHGGARSRQARQRLRGAPAVERPPARKLGSVRGARSRRQRGTGTGAAAQQLVEHDAQRVDVGGGGDRLAAELLGRGVVRASSAAARASRHGGRPPAAGSSTLAMPKSSSLACPSAVTRMFEGLRSRCTTRLRCAYSTASQTWRNRRSRLRGRAGPPVAVRR